MTQPLTSHMKPARWIKDAICAEVGGDVCFPEKGERVAPVKRICRRCPVTAECLAYALERDERFGVWGGMSPEERHQLKEREGSNEQR